VIPNCLSSIKLPPGRRRSTSSPIFTITSKSHT
jgi:hypothetical protein